MKKKVVLVGIVVLMLAIGLFILAGCGAKKEAEPVDETLFKINGLEFHLDQEKEYKGMKYVISGDFKKAEYEIGIPCIQYNYYQEDGTNLLFFRIFFYEGKTNEDAVKDLDLGAITLTEGKTDNIEYKLYEEPRDDGTIHFYFVNKDNNTYVINFVSRYDIKDFEEKVMKTIKF